MLATCAHVLVCKSSWIKLGFYCFFLAIVGDGSVLPLSRRLWRPLKIPSTADKQQRLAQAAKAVSQVLDQVVNCLPGQIEFDQTIKAIAGSSRRLQSGR